MKTLEFKPRGERMFEDPVFGWIAYLHLANLKQCLPQAARRESFIESDDEHCWKGAKGGFFISNGDPLEYLIRDGLILERDVKSRQKVVTVDDFLTCVAQNQGDGAFVMSKIKSEMAKTSRIYIPKDEAEKIDKYVFVPDNFNHINRDVPLRETNIGVKTETAIMLPRLDERIRTAIIKKSPYANTGLGMAAGFNYFGLREQMFFLQDDASPGMIDPAYFGVAPESANGKALKSMVPIYRRFTNTGGKRVDFEKALRIDASGKMEFADYETADAPKIAASAYRA